MDNGKKPKRKKTHQTFAKLFVLLMIAAILAMNSLFIHEVYKDRQYLKNDVLQGDVTQKIDGKIKTAKQFYAGRSHNNIKIHVSGLKKWIYFTGVEDEEKEVLQKGNNISVSTYPRRPDTPLIDNEYYKNSILFSLGYSVNGQEIISDEDKINEKLSGNTMFIALLAVVELLLLVTFFALYKTYFSNRKSNV